MTASIGLHAGGTFTDLVTVSLDDDMAHGRKVPRTPHDQGVGVGRGLARARAGGGWARASVESGA